MVFAGQDQLGRRQPCLLQNGINYGLPGRFQNGGAVGRLAALFLVGEVELDGQDMMFGDACVQGADKFRVHVITGAVRNDQRMLKMLGNQPDRADFSAVVDFDAMIFRFHKE